MELKNYVGQQIKKWREIRGLNQEELAAKMGVTKQTISRYENGDRKANQDVLFEIAEALNVSVNEFFPKRESTTSSKLETLAAHIDDDVSEQEMNEIMKYIEFVKSQRK